MMSEFSEKIKKAIIEYEKTRQEIARLKNKRRELLDKCNMFDVNGGMVCLAVAYSEFEVDPYVYGSKTQFLKHLERMHEHGECCNRCLESYRIKAVDLIDATRAHGVAKNNLTRIGKKLINDQSQ